MYSGRNNLRAYPSLSACGDECKWMPPRVCNRRTPPSGMRRVADSPAIARVQTAHLSKIVKVRSDWLKLLIAGANIDTFRLPGLSHRCAGARPRLRQALPPNSVLSQPQRRSRDASAKESSCVAQLFHTTALTIMHRLARRAALPLGACAVLPTTTKSRAEDRAPAVQRRLTAVADLAIEAQLFQPAVPWPQWDCNWDHRELDSRGCDLRVLKCRGAFTPSTRLVSIRRGRGWFLF